MPPRPGWRRHGRRRRPATEADGHASSPGAPGDDGRAGDEPPQAPSSEPGQHAGADGRRSLSEYQAVWLFTMFDLPVDTKEARKEYANFRKTLLKHGFSMMQFSVYARYFPSEEASEVHRDRIAAFLPPDGHVRLLTVTDRQFGKMQVFYGKTKAQPEKAPRQLVLF